MRIVTVLLIIMSLFRVDAVAMPDWKFQELNGCLKHNSEDGNYYFIVDSEMQNENWWRQETPWPVREMTLEEKSIPEKKKFVVVFKTDYCKPEHFYDYAVAGIVYSQRRTKIALVSQPCSVLLSGEDPYSPVRTNTWPESQVALAASLQRDFEVELLDLRSLSDPGEWRKNLSGEYAEPISYGELTLRRYLIGNYYERIAECTANVFVLTANFTAESNSVARVIEVIREVHPEALILVGGRDASASERHQFYINAGADFIGIGDGDLSLPKFLSEISEKSKYDSRLISGGIPCDFCQKKFDFNLKDFDRYRYRESGGGPIGEGVLSGKSFVAYFETSRGCVRDCPYCTEANTSRWVEPVNDVKARIDQYVAGGCRLFMISDDNLLLRNSSDLVEIFKYLREHRVAWEFPVGLEMQLLIDPKGGLKENLFEALFWNNINSGSASFAGVHRLLLPLEDILLRQSDLKKLSRAQNEATGVINKLLDVRIPFLNVAIMIGDPKETMSDRIRLENNLEQLYDIARGSNTQMNFSIFCMSPLPGTPFGREMTAKQRLAYSIEDAPELWTIATSVINGDEFSAIENTSYRRKLLSRFNMAQKEGKVFPL